MKNLSFSIVLLLSFSSIFGFLPTSKAFSSFSTPTSSLNQWRSGPHNGMATPPPSQSTACRIALKSTSSSSSSSSLQMGLFDFLKSRNEGDFIKLDRSSNNNDCVGPGPLIVMYAVPESMDLEELKDMVQDGMPNRRRGEVALCRIRGMMNSGDDGSDGTYDDDFDETTIKSEGDDELLDLSVKDALNTAMERRNTIMEAADSPMLQTNEISPSNAPITPARVSVELRSTQEEQNKTPCPVLYFSGVTNTEMMETYNIIANEIYQETNRIHWPACAKVVEPAMDKSMRRVLLEISRDHADAMRMRREEQ